MDKDTIFMSILNENDRIISFTFFAIKILVNGIITADKSFIPIIMLKVNPTAMEYYIICSKFYKLII